MTIVYGRGPEPCDVLLCGEAPGKAEAERGEPFVGISGMEQAGYLAREGLNVRSFYRTNVIKAYTEGNPDPTPEQIEEWTPVLEKEIRHVQPRLVVAVGRFAARWFLGESIDMELVHGIPHHAGAFDPARRNRSGGAVVLPIYHPASGLYDDDFRVWISWDYRQVAETLDLIRRSKPIPYRVDPFAKKTNYRDVSGKEFASIVSDRRVEALGLDTEGSPTEPWSLQISAGPGGGATLRTSRPDFLLGISALARRATGAPRQRARIVLHNAMFDMEMCRAMGLNLRDADIWDSMYAAYLTRLEPQGLKPLAYRWCGMTMKSYEETVGDAGIEKQLEFLEAVMDRLWEKPDPIIELGNDGLWKSTQPKSIDKVAWGIIQDYLNGKKNKKGERVDPYKRWKNIHRPLRETVESVMGPMPVGTLGDIPLQEAVDYASRDADATLRLYHVLSPHLKSLDLDELQAAGSGVIPIFEEMQASGMPASRPYFADLKDKMESKMAKLQAAITRNYFDGRPFNPASSQQVATLMRRRNLVGSKRTKTGAVSTGKKSIEHLRDQDDAIGKIIEWREHQKIRDAFCEPVLERIPPHIETMPVRCNIKVTRVHTRRLAASDPNLLAIPVRHDLGRLVRDGYRCPPGEVLGAWDLSQVEMRAMAHLSKDPLLIEFFNSDRDIHAETAARIFGLNPKREWNEEKEKWVYPFVDEKKHRYPAKRAAFGIITSIQGQGLLDQLRMANCLGWDEKSCAKLITDWLRVYSGVSRYMDNCKNRVRKTGMIRDPWKMIRYLPGVWAVDRKVRMEAERAASSHAIQGCAQGMIQNSMRWLDKHIRMLQEGGVAVTWVLQIHDEIILRFPDRWWEPMNDLVTEALTKHHGMGKMLVPIEASGHMSQSWGGLK